MTTELLLPGWRVPAPEPPERIALNMAFGVGNPAILGDKSRYNSHGTIVGAVPAAGVHGYCLDFDPTIPSYVEIPAAHTQLDFTSGDFSIIARINVDDLTITRILFIRGLWNVDGYRISIAAGGEIEGYTFQAAANQRTRSAAGDIVVGTNYTIGISRTGASIRTFRNGVDVTATPAVHIDPTTSARSAKIGVDDGLILNPWDGKIEFLRIFRGIALAASEHLAWHNALV